MSSMRKRKGDYRMIRLKARRVIAFLLVLLMLCSATVFAVDLEEVPYYSYCYWEGPSRTDPVPMRAMYEAYQQVDGDTLGTSKLTDAEHLALSQDYKELYVLDSGNSRILVLDTEDFSLLREIHTIPYSKGDFTVARRVNQVKPNTDYVMTWYTRNDEGTSRFGITVSDTKTGKAIKTAAKNIFPSYRPTYEKDETTGAYVLDEDGQKVVDNEPIWQKNQLTFNSGSASEIAFEITNDSQTRSVYYLDNMSLVEKAQLDAVSVEVVYENDGIAMQEVEDGYYPFVVKTTVIGQTTVAVYTVNLTYSVTVDAE